MLKKAIGSISDETFEMIAMDYDIVHLKHSEESRKKMSKVRKGMKHSEEEKRKISEAHKGRKPTWRMKRVLCIETGEIFESTRDVERKTGIDNGNVSKACLGKLKTAGGLHWKFV